MKDFDTFTKIAKNMGKIIIDAGFEKLPNLVPMETLSISHIKVSLQSINSSVMCMWMCSGWS